ncbi:hypothetical protein [Hydrogenophaga sp. MI9]|uniref:hypothetical protein n=1 Tax=Hydrogenophaga sp. MI9 TaxID=3453719 RepID=UPI003EEFA7C3
MVRIVNSDIEIVYEWELFLEPMPRSVLLLSGLSLVAGASTFALVEFARPGAIPYPARDLYGLCAAVLAAGLLMSLRAALSTRHRMSSITIADAGITFRWKPEGRFGKTPGAQEQFVAWDDMERVEWTEEGQEHEFKQYLGITLRQPIAGNRRSFRFLICDTRSYRECQALHAKIPRHAPRPGSLSEALKFQ